MGTVYFTDFRSSQVLTFLTVRSFHTLVRWCLKKRVLWMHQMSRKRAEDVHLQVIEFSRALVSAFYLGVRPS